MSSTEPIIQDVLKRQAPHGDVEAQQKRPRYDYDADGFGGNYVPPLTLISSESWSPLCGGLNQPSDNSTASSTGHPYGINDDSKVRQSAREDERPESPIMDWSPPSFREPTACMEICFGAVGTKHPSPTLHLQLILS